MKNRIFFFLFFIFSTALIYGENNWQEELFTQSPRIQYLKKELQKRESIHKLIETAPEKVSNPLLFKESLIYLIHSLEIEKEKFFILKEVAEIFHLLEKMEKEIQLYKKIENFFPLSFSPPELSPHAKLWQEKESNWLNEEIKRKSEEKSFYLNLLKENFNIENKIEISRIFHSINPGFEKEIVNKKREILEGEENYFLKNKEKYPQLPYSLKVSTSLPYVYFYLPLNRSIDKEIYNLLFMRDKIELKILELENSFAEEEISIKFNYLQKKKEILQEILDKIEEIKKLVLSFEEASSLKEIFLKTSLSLIELEYKEAMLKEEILRYNLSPSEKEGEVLPPLPSFSSILEFAEGNSLYLEKLRKELFIIKKLASSPGGIYRNYLQRLWTWKESSYEKEKAYLEKELFSLWYRLKLTQKRYSIEKEEETLLYSLHKLISQSPTKPLSEKKLKEIELFSQKLSLKEREEEMALIWLELRRKIATSLEINLSSTEERDESLEKLYGKYFPETNLKDKEREAYKELKESEIPLFLKKEGKIIYSPKEELLAGKLPLNFIIEIIPSPISFYTWNQNFNPEAYFRIREKFEKNNEEREKNCNQQLQKISHKRIQSLKQRLAEEKEMLKDLKKNFSLDLPERIIQQELRISRLENQILEKEVDYLGDFLSAQNSPFPTLEPYQEKILLEKLSPIIKNERLILLIETKERESLFEAMITSFALKNQKKKNIKLLSLFSTLKETLNILSFKQKTGLILPEELSEFKFTKDGIEEEIYQNKRKIISLRKKENLPQEIKLPDMSHLKERIDSLTKEIISEDPYLKLVEQEIKISLPQEIDFLNLLYQERKAKLEKETKLLLQSFSLQKTLLDARQKTEKILAEQLKNALEDLKSGVLSLYGAYGLNSILSKYREEIAKLFQIKENLTEIQIRLWNLKENKKSLNLSSLIPSLGSVKKKVLTYLRRELSLTREREKRREEFISQNYNQKIHAFKFLKEEEEKKKIYKPIEELFRTAREKELENSEYLDKIWQKEEAFRERIEKEIAKSGIEIEKEILPIAEILLCEEDKKEILKLLFINYARRLKKEEYLKEYLKDIQELFSILPLDADKIDNLASWWAKYISSLLSYPEKIYLEEIIDPRLLGLYLYYVELKRYLDLKDIQLLIPQIEKDKVFLFSELYSLSQEKVPEYLYWVAEKQRDLENLFFSQWPFEKWENQRKKFLHSTKQLFGYTYGSLKDKTLQKEIVNWLIISGITEEKFPSFIELVEIVSKEIKKIFPELSLEEKLRIKEAVRLRWLFSQKEESLIQEEEKRLEEAIFIGNLLSWSEFFWENQIRKEEIPLFFSFIERLRKNPLFIKIYGKEENQKNERREFYISSLSYWAEKWLKFHQENPQEAEERIKISLSRFHLLYSLPSFQKLYGQIDLNTINPEKGKEKRLLREFMGKIGFFLNWTLDFSLTDEETKIFFDDLYLLFTHKELLENFYKNQGIELKLTWRDSKEKEEIMGILINWLQFFHYRGIKGEEKILSALEEIAFIQEKSQKYKLVFNIDEIRYWWEKTKIKGYTLNFLEQIFSHAYYLKNLLPQVCNELWEEINQYIGEDIELRKKLEETIRSYRKNFSRPEIFNLAEKIMPLYNLSPDEIKKYYKERICLEVYYQIFNQNKALPEKITQLHSLMKETGYSLREMGSFLNLYAHFRKNETLAQTFPSDLEIYAILQHFFKQIPPYEKKLLFWMEKASFLIQCFYQEHKRKPDFSLLKNLINSSLLRMRPWQIELLVKKGVLNRNSPDVEIKELVQETDFKRYLLRLYWENLKEILPIEEIEELYKIYLSIPKDKAKVVFKEAIERYAIFQEEFIELMLKIFYEKNIPFAEVSDYLKEKLAFLRKKVLFPLLYYLSSEKEKEIKERKQKLLIQQESLPTEKIYFPQPFSRRKFFQKEIVEKTKVLISINLPSHKAAALTWKVLEGLSIEEVLKVYIKDYRELENLYKEIFIKEKLNPEEISIINYFCEEINFGNLDKEDFFELLNITKEIKDCFEKIFRKTFSLQEALDYSWAVLYSGGNREMVREIFVQADELIKNIYPTKENDTAFLKDLLFSIGNLYNIGIGEKTLSVYSKEDYLKAIEIMFNFLAMEKRDLNYKELEKIVKNASLLFLSPAKFLFFAWQTNYLVDFSTYYATKISKKEMLIYLDLLKKETINFLNLSKVFYESPVEVVIIHRIENALSSAFKNFLKENL